MNRLQQLKAKLFGKDIIEDKLPAHIKLESKGDIETQGYPDSISIINTKTGNRYDVCFEKKYGEVGTDECVRLKDDKGEILEERRVNSFRGSFLKEETFKISPYRALYSIANIELERCQKEYNNKKELAKAQRDKIISKKVDEFLK
ncbi:MAG: hypothetical protein IJ770_00270 [Alphaproteobacteria bacterium]|nr:hypothetical protein [Alphaproteobacteria bacterium]